MAERAPNPGSREAQELGCTCPVIDNHRGAGFELAGERVWWFHDGCPVHAHWPDALAPAGEEGRGDG